MAPPAAEGAADLKWSRRVTAAPDTAAALYPVTSAVAADEATNGALKARCAVPVAGLDATLMLDAESVAPSPIIPENRAEPLVVNLAASTWLPVLKIRASVVPAPEVDSIVRVLEAVVPPIKVGAVKLVPVAAPKTGADKVGPVAKTTVLPEPVVVAAEIAVPFPESTGELTVVDRVIAGVEVAVATVPAKPLVDTTEMLVTVPEVAGKAHVGTPPLMVRTFPLLPLAKEDNSPPELFRTRPATEKVERVRTPPKILGSVPDWLMK